MAEQILVIQNKYLLKYKIFTKINDDKLLDDFISKSYFVNRGAAESDLNTRQIIPYTILRYKNKILSYLRSDLGDETRLHRLHSVGIGGHINRHDETLKNNPNENIITRARDRELLEELEFTARSHPCFVGILNDDSNIVGRVHVGIIYELWLNNMFVKSREEYVHTNVEFFSKEKLMQSLEDYESWSRIIISKYL